MKNARFLLHLLLITALSAALYPFPLLLAIWSGSAGWTAPVMTAALVLCVWLGTLYILLLRRQYARHPRWVNGGVWALTLLLCVLGSLFAPYPTRLAQVLLGITAGGCFFGGARLVFHPLEHLVHPNVFVGLCLWDCFSGFLIYLTGVKLPFLPMVLLFAANAALFALVHNRDAMERMLSGRDGDTWELPTEIRRSNGRLMGILCGVGLALVLCSRPLARGMRWLWRWIYTGFFYALRWLLSLGSSSDTAEEIPESARDKLMELPQNSTSGWVRLVIELVLWRLCWRWSSGNGTRSGMPLHPPGLACGSGSGRICKRTTPPRKTRTAVHTAIMWKICCTTKNGSRHSHTAKPPQLEKGVPSLSQAVQRSRTVPVGLCAAAGETAGRCGKTGRQPGGDPGTFTDTAPGGKFAFSVGDRNAGVQRPAIRGDSAGGKRFSGDGCLTKTAKIIDVTIIDITQKASLWEQFPQTGFSISKSFLKPYSSSSLCVT